MEFVNLKFADERMIKMQTLLPALRWSRANVSLNGPTGTGKSTLAKYIVSGGSFEALDVSEVREDFKFSEFFNQTVAQTFLIENVDGLTASRQKELYEALDALDGNSSESKRRLVSTSREALKSLVQKNLFREDLYYRLTVLTLEMPALESRLCDLETLADHLITVFGIIHKKRELVLTPRALEKMRGWNWPGNLRELENVLERAVILSRDGIIDAAEISLEAQSLAENPAVFAGLTLSQVEQKLILQTLNLTEQNRTRAAEILGISIRTLRNKINEYKQAGVV
jgi:two-component system response regulator FlrC